ncbi:MAG: hypothetical protein K9M11_01250 [Candidatus Pacebacteria bacterium]|nr:hypothetical protein [Candidatus Paceibacterota bacterium]
MGQMKVALGKIDAGVIAELHIPTGGTLVREFHHDGKFYRLTGQRTTGILRFKLAVCSDERKRTVSSSFSRDFKDKVIGILKGGTFCTTAPDKVTYKWEVEEIPQ